MTLSGTIRRPMSFVVSSPAVRVRNVPWQDVSRRLPRARRAVPAPVAVANGPDATRDLTAIRASAGPAQIPLGPACLPSPR